MVIDTSALIAILQRQPERRVFLEILEDANLLRMSAATFVEVSIVFEARHGAEGLRDLDQLLSRAGVEIIPVDLEQAQAARIAFSRFGKGLHRAALNYGDCFSYALAAVSGEPLLCKGNDFVHTDVAIARAPLA